ncbi:MAG: MaoC family dehydratase N-terminal domain-containing protein [Fidelibacterota bacterium]
MNREVIGKTYPPVSYEVCREKIREYARATLQKNPLYTNPEFARSSSYGNIVAPPMFAAVYCGEIFNQVFFDKELGIHLPHIVHGEQEFVFVEVVRSGDVITSVAQVVDVFSRESSTGGVNEFCVVKTESRNQNGELVSTGKWTVVERGI